MPCKIIKNASGQTAMIVCSRSKRREPCRWCSRPYTKLCDFKLRGSKIGQTCDAPMCNEHAHHIGHDLDLCPPHIELWLRERDLAKRNELT